MFHPPTITRRYARAVIVALAMSAAAGCTTAAAVPEPAHPYQSGASGSGQGGYLGRGAGSHQTSAEAGATHESHQGGYLGQNVGADLKPPVMPTGDMRESPTK